MLHYRLLPPDEWAALAPIFRELGGRLPPEGSSIAVAEDGSQIVAFLVLQFVPHAEPLWIAPDYRGKASWRRLLGLAETQMQSNGGGAYYVFAPTPRIAQIARVAGLTALPWTVFQKEVN